MKDEFRQGRVAMIMLSEDALIDLRTLYQRLHSGAFYDDHDEDLRLVGVLRKVLTMPTPAAPDASDQPHSG